MLLSRCGLTHLSFAIKRGAGARVTGVARTSSRTIRLGEVPIYGMMEQEVHNEVASSTREPYSL